MAGLSAWTQWGDALEFCSPKKHSTAQVTQSERPTPQQNVSFVAPTQERGGKVVQDQEEQNARLISLIRHNTIGIKSNEEKDGIWTVQGFLRDEAVDAYPKNQMSDLIVKDCAGEKSWTTIFSHGSCRKLAVVNCTQVRILCDHAMEEGLISRCNTVELVLGGHPPKLVLDKCRTIRLITSRPKGKNPDLECNDSVQIIYQAAVLQAGDSAAAEDVMRAPKFDPVVVRGNVRPAGGKTDDDTSSSSQPQWKSSTMQPSDSPVINTSAGHGSADIGVELSATAESYMKIARVIPYGGAFSSGQVKTGDALHSVDGVPVYGKSVDEVAERLKGGVGTSVLLALQSQGLTGLKGMWKTVLVERVQLDPSQRARNAALDLGFGITVVANHNSEAEVSEVKSGSSAEATGRISVGDVVMEVEGVETPYAEDVLRAMTLQPRARMSLKVRKVGGQVAAVALSKEISQVTELLGRQWCSVKHSYLPRQVDELELEAGESVFIVEAAEDDGWYIAEREGKRGLVPATHVVFHGHEAAPSATVRMAQASHSYNAMNSDEISFKKGDVIPIFSEAADPGWYVSRVDGRDGLVPSTHVVMLTSTLPAVPMVRPSPTAADFNWSTAGGGAAAPASCWSCGKPCEGGVVFCPVCKAPLSLADKAKVP